MEDVLRLIREEFEKIPDGGPLIEKVSSRLQKTYDEPPIEDFEFATRKTFTKEELQTALFHPLDEQIAYYPALLTVSASTGPEHSVRKTASLILTLVYLVHRLV